jgi:hypothetical protein
MTARDLVGVTYAMFVQDLCRFGLDLTDAANRVLSLFTPAPKQKTHAAAAVTVADADDENAKNTAGMRTLQAMLGQMTAAGMPVARVPLKEQTA